MVDFMVYWLANAPIYQLILGSIVAWFLGILLIYPYILRLEEMAKYTKSKRRATYYKSKRLTNKYKHRFSGQSDRGRKWHRNRLFARDNTCGLCGKPILNAKDATVDHIIPQGAGGADTIENMQLAHKSCNQDKGSYHPKNDLDGSAVLL